MFVVHVIWNPVDNANPMMSHQCDSVRVGFYPFLMGPHSGHPSTVTWSAVGPGNVIRVNSAAIAHVPNITRVQLQPVMTMFKVCFMKPEGTAEISPRAPQGLPSPAAIWGIRIICFLIDIPFWPDALLQPIAAPH